MVTSERQHLIETILRDQRRIFDHAVQTGSSGLVLSRLDLTMTQLRAFFIVAEREPMPVGGLGVALGIGKAAATLLVNALARHRLVDRSEDPADRRRTLVRLTAHAQDVLEEFRQGRREQMVEWVSQLDDDDLAALARGIGALASVATGTDPHPDLPPTAMGGR